MKNDALFVIAVSSSIPQFIIIQIRTQADNPALLDGLDAWLNLGLISDEQVKQLCQHYLSQRLPQPTVIQPTTIQPPQKPDQPVLSSPTQLNRFTQLWQSFQAEFSIRWLLFLGLFMVVVSSGVLAASQWERFPALGQYGVLFAYTLGFFAASFWASHSHQLPLTAQTLRWVTLLLIPLNFWAINGLGLWQGLINIFAITISTIILTGIVILLNFPQRYSHPLPIINQLILSYLHLGWGMISGFPLIAVYSGILTSAFVSLRQRHQKENPSFLAYIFPFGFLLTRATLVNQVPWHYLAFAIGLSGWLLYHRSSKIWRRLAYFLLAISWLIAFENQPWQAFGISLLGIHIVTQNLQQFWRKSDIAGLFLIGLQTFILIGRLIPDNGQEIILTTATQLTQAQGQLNVLIALSWFPYVILWALITEKLYQIFKAKLAGFGEKINLGLGLFLTSLGLFNPLVRSLNLLASTVLLFIITHRRPNSTRIYLTHLTILLTILSGIHWQFMNLNRHLWVIILLGLMVTEWIFYRWRLNHPDPDDSKTALLTSSAYFGFGLAGISYILLLEQFDLIALLHCRTTACAGFSPWSLSWLITPMLLTVLAYSYYRPNPKNHKFYSITPIKPLFKATEWSSISCILIQFLTLGLPRIRLISLGISTILLFLNSRIKPHQSQARLTIGFVLVTIGMGLWEGIPGFPTLSITNLWIVVAIILNSLWLLHRYLIRHSTPLSQSYSTAIHDWMNILLGFELISLTLYSAAIYNQLLPPSFSVLIATSLTLIPILYQGWIGTHFPVETEENQVFKISPAVIYCFSWTIELLMAQILSFTPRSMLYLAMANVLMGLLTQWLGNRLKNQITPTPFPHPWQMIPLCYGLLGILLRINQFDQLTGLMGLGVAFICISIGCHSRDFKPLVYIGLFGISFSLSQIVFYQVLSQSFAQQSLALAGVETSILYGYRILSRPLTRWIGLSEIELKIIADLHWGIASLFWFLSLSILPSHLLGLSLGMGLFLIRDAILQGRTNEPKIQAEIWVYLGIVQALYLIYSITPYEWMNILLLPWMGAIASVISYFLYLSPWQQWGWMAQPWQRTALFLPISFATFSLIVLPYSYRIEGYTSTLIAIIFYLFLSRFTQKIRCTYPALFLANLVIICELLSTKTNLDLVWWVTPITLSCLYIVQVDSSLKSPQQQHTRHLIRCFATGLICGSALISYQWTGIIPGIFSLVAIFAGLGLRVRAFLYIGTATFLINTGNQLILLNATYSFLKWVIGFCVGLTFIWIAANFETRREQVFTLFQESFSQLNDWE